ncbi:MAG: DHHA1 domain-containing protein [Haloferacaceae archaeon]
MTAPVPALADRARACARRLLSADSVLLASHIDADGLTSAAVAATALSRAGLPFEVTFAKQLDADALDGIAATDHDTVLFTDFGSGQLGMIAERAAAGAFTPVIADHHQPADATAEYHLNPLLAGIDGASELSGAGTAYVLARALAREAGEGAGAGAGEAGPGDIGDGGDDPRADGRDLAGLAAVGAVGDMQAGADGLHGANGRIVEEGVAAGVLAAERDLSLYGRQTRPLPKLLEYASDARIPGITGTESGAVDFLAGLDVDLRDADGDWRRWVDLTADERRTVVSGLVRHAMERGVPAERIERLVGTTYTLVGEEPGTELRDVSEFSTLLNATARYERADVGLAVCLGDRGAALDRARALLREHRRNLSEGLDLVTSEGVERTEHLQWFDAGTRIRETIVGIVAGMALGADGVDRDRPIVAFAAKGEDDLKVSARGSGGLVGRGLDLSAVMREAAGEVGGEGGGHDVAAGATIPAGARDAFLAAADALVGDQLG